MLPSTRHAALFLHYLLNSLYIIIKSVIISKFQQYRCLFFQNQKIFWRWGKGDCGWNIRLVGLGKYRSVGFWKYIIGVGKIQQWGLGKYSSGVGKIQQWGWEIYYQGWENTVVGLGKYSSGVGKILYWGWKNTVVGLGNILLGLAKYSSGVGKIQ